MKQTLTIILISFMSVQYMFAQTDDTLSVKSEQPDTVAIDSTDFVKASILFMERDKSSVVTYYGHIALHLSCPSEDLDFVFTFDSNESYGFHEAITGLEKVSLIPAPFDAFIERYSSEGRDVYEYRLNLTLEEARNLWRIVDQYVAKGAYLNNDYLNSGCAQETASLVLASINGTIEYSDLINQIGNDQYSITSKITDYGSWFRLFLSAFVSTDAHRELTNEQKLFLPSDMIDVWNQSSIINPDGSKRKVFMNEEPVVYKAKAKKAEEAHFIDTRVFFSIILVLVLIASVFFVIKPTNKVVVQITDRIILTFITVIAVLLLSMYSIANIPAGQGWCHSFVVFNIIPFIIWLIGRKTKMSTKNWAKVYILYSGVLLFQVTWMLLQPNAADIPEIILTTALLIYTIAKIIYNYKLNKLLIN